jgi:transcriptional regulator GlxA family with amidase domain
VTISIGVGILLSFLLLRDNHNTRVRIEALCDASGMSRASLHRHFLAMTALSSLQYHKQLRLPEARICCSPATTAHPMCDVPTPKCSIERRRLTTLATSFLMML